MRRKILDLKTNMPIRESESERTKIYTCNYKWKIFHDHYLNIYEIALFFRRLFQIFNYKFREEFF
jgi:hypothetical protein